MAKTKEKKSHKIRNTFAGLVTLGIAYVASCALVPQDVILQGTIMNDVDLSGATIEEAQQMLEDQYEENYKDAALTINALDKDYKVPMHSSCTLDAKAAAEEAFAFGHSSFLLRGAEMIQGMTMKKTMVHYPEISNQEALDQEMEKAGVSTLNTTVQTTYELLEDDLQFTKGTTGYSVDMEALDLLVTGAVMNNDYSTVIEAPLIQGTVEPIDVDQIYEEVYKEKREATLDPKKDYKIVRSVTGIDFDKEEAKKAVNEAAEGAVVKVPIKKDKPKINTDKLKKHLFEAVLGSCTTNVSGTEARKSNVRLASSTINGIILMPGEEFSYNDRVGERTEARGYKKAPAYFNGQSVDELGGGICQVSSTLYKATVLANLEITEHHNHTYESSYIGLGMDATVSWGGPNYRFKNNMDYPIKISAEYSGGTLTCQIIGAKLTNNKVLFTNEVLKTIGFGTKYVDDNTLEKGKEKVMASGHNGYVVQTYRTIVDENGNKISTSKEDYNVYSKKDQEVARGTKPVDKKKDKKKEKKDASEADKPEAQSEE